MTDSPAQTATRQAEVEINAILARLEAETGRMVEDVTLRNIDVTRIDTSGKEWLTGAVITLQKTPANRRWEAKP